MSWAACSNTTMSEYLDLHDRCLDMLLNTCGIYAQAGSMHVSSLPAIGVSAWSRPDFVRPASGLNPGQLLGQHKTTKSFSRATTFYDGPVSRPTQVLLDQFIFQHKTARPESANPASPPKQEFGKPAFPPKHESSNAASPPKQECAIPASRPYQESAIPASPSMSKPAFPKHESADAASPVKQDSAIPASRPTGVCHPSFSVLAGLCHPSFSAQQESAIPASPLSRTLPSQLLGPSRSLPSQLLDPS
ncbi:hypothetical protein AVEN_161925-1 [Araneus ventricosus]|uniref:Uncharacterized protein n=1 Tax=Araneus ventricosus TaxID=182803 RepID=A0A4Y2SMS0_ARAVE|nr:hypothetical protein AVEN_161925-1 [Araneus ventricosus]